MAIWAADVCSRTARQLICTEHTGLRLRHIGKTDPQCGTVQFCFRSGRLTCSARTGFRAVTTPLISKGPRAWVEFLGRGQPAPSAPGRGSGERCKLPQRGPPRPLKGFLAFYRRQVPSPGTCCGPSSGGPRPP